MLHRASGADEQTQHLTQRRLVERTARAARRDAERHGTRHLEQHELSYAPHVAIQIALRNALRFPEGERARDHRRHHLQHAARDRRNSHVRLARQKATGRAQDRFGIRPTPDQARQRNRLVQRRALIAPDGFRVPLNLRVHRVTQAEPLVAQFIDEFGFEYPLGRIDVANGFVQAEWKKSVDGGEHRTTLDGRAAGQARQPLKLTGTG